MELAKVVSVNVSAEHSMYKVPMEEIILVDGLGVEGDAHYGKKVKHRYLVRKDPDRPNLRQVHLIHSELFEELRKEGFSIGNGEMGENITTRNIDLLNLPTNTILTIGETQIKITGLREPCSQLNDIQKGLMKQLVWKNPDGSITRKAGIMSIVLRGGKIKPNDRIHIELPPEPHIPLTTV